VVIIAGALTWAITRRQNADKGDNHENKS
jgi:hypothetical protein